MESMWLNQIILSKQVCLKCIWSIFYFHLYQYRLVLPKIFRFGKDLEKSLPVCDHEKATFPYMVSWLTSYIIHISAVIHDLTHNSASNPYPLQRCQNTTSWLVVSFSLFSEEYKIIMCMLIFIYLFIYAFFIEGNKFQWLALLSKKALIFKT